MQYGFIIRERTVKPVMFHNGEWRTITTETIVDDIVYPNINKARHRLLNILKKKFRKNSYKKYSFSNHTKHIVKHVDEVLSHDIHKYYTIVQVKSDVYTQEEKQIWWKARCRFMEELYHELDVMQSIHLIDDKTAECVKIGMKNKKLY